ncbi:MAG: hypothetical protein ACLR8L_09365 [Oscillospiraceae bacterium]
MIFFMYSFLLKIFAVNAAILLYGICTANPDSCILIDSMQKKQSVFSGLWAETHKKVSGIAKKYLAFSALCYNCPIPAVRFREERPRT